MTLIGKDLEGSGRGLIVVIFRNLLRGTEENHQISQDKRCRGWDSTRAPPEYKPSVLPLDHPVRSRI
jgi:hypothetical protein